MQFYKDDSVTWSYKRTTGSGIIVSIQKDFYKVKSEEGIYYLPIQDTKFKNDTSVCNECKCGESEKELGVCVYGEECKEKQYLCEECALSYDHNICRHCSRFVYCEDTIMIYTEQTGIVDLCHECYEEDDSVYYDEETEEYKFK
jgi:hypothetical protein